VLRRFGVNYAIFCLVMDAALVASSLALAEWWRPNLDWLPFSRPLGPLDDQTLVPLPLHVVIPLLWLGVLAVLSLYNPRAIFKTGDELRILVLGSSFAGLATAGLLFLSYREVSRWLFLVFVATAFSLLVAWRLAARLLTALLGRSPAPQRRVLIVGAGPLGHYVARLIERYRWAGLRLVGYLDETARDGVAIPILGSPREVRAVVQAERVNEVVIALPTGGGTLHGLVNDLLDLPLRVRVIPECFTLALDRPSIEDFAGVPMVDLRAGPLSDYQRIVKRVIDLIVAMVAGLVTLPLMGVIGLLIKLDSPGPILFKQPRVGENGNLFTMYKFRSMVEGAESMLPPIATDGGGTLVHKHPEDPRVTRVGRFLRRASFDELPQLWNVLRGDMSLVGPRPVLPGLVVRYEPGQRRRLVVPPGMTGWWQVNGRAEKPMHLHADDDLYYIANYSFWLDMRILWKTLWVVLDGRGAH
jgi:exopolysaccharide biosynthesis polyprenyl glycosylphosphotransferase